MAVVAVPFILYLVRFCSSKSCNTRNSKSAANHFLWKGEKLSCMRKCIGTMSTIRRHLPIPGLYEMIPTFGAS